MSGPIVYDFYKMRPCEICGKKGPNDVHHIRTRGAGGGNYARNLSTLCRVHHQEIHVLGVRSFVRKYKLDWSVGGIYPSKKGE